MSRSSQATKGKSDFLIGMTAIAVAFVAATFVFGLDKYSESQRDATVQKIIEYCRSNVGVDPPTASQFRTLLSGSPATHEMTADGQTMIIYEWPGLFQRHLIRAKLNSQSQVVAVDVVSTPTAKDEEIVRRVAVTEKVGLIEVRPPTKTDSPTPQPTRFASFVSDRVDDPHDEQVDLLQAIRTALAQPSIDFAPGVVVFPLIDEHDASIPGGSALSAIANYTIICSPHKRLSIDPRQVRRVLTEGGFWRAGTKFTKQKYIACLTEIGASQFVIARIVDNENGKVLKIEFRDQVSAERNRDFEHRINPGDETRIPGLIALDILPHLGIELTAGEAEWAAAPQLAKFADAIELENYIPAFFPGTDPGLEIDPFLERNPECVLAWDLALAGDRRRGVTRLRPKPSDSRVLACSCVQRGLVNQIKPTPAVVKLLESAAQRKGEISWWQTVIQQTMRASMLMTNMLGIDEYSESLVNDDAIAELFDAWEKEAVGYPEQVALGRLLTQWAWRARGSGTADTISPEGGRLFVNRLERALKLLTRAAQSAPNGWRANKELLTVSMGLGLPLEFSADRYADVARVAPGDADAVGRMLTLLHPKWGGSIQLRYQFARQIAQIGEWSSNIPQKVPGILLGGRRTQDVPGESYAVTRNALFWDVLNEYAVSAQKQNDDQIRRIATRYYGILGVQAGHEREVCDAFNRMIPDLRDFPLPEQWLLDAEDDFIEDPAEQYKRFATRTDQIYSQLRDRVLATTDDSNLGRLAAVRISLAEARLDDAENKLAAISPMGPVETEEVDRCKLALELGRKLYRDKEIELTPNDILNTFAVYEVIECRGALKKSPWWNSAGEYARWNVPAVNPQPADRPPFAPRHTALFPIGIKHGKISGIMEVVGGNSRIQVLYHTQGLRSPFRATYHFTDRATVYLSEYARKHNGKINAEPIPFEAIFGPDGDNLKPFPGVDWHVDILDDVPSTFGFAVYDTEPQQSLSLKKIKISIMP